MVGGLPELTIRATNTLHLRRYTPIWAAPSRVTVTEGPVTAS
jgi:hypothetical protein